MKKVIILVLIIIILGAAIFLYSKRSSESEPTGDISSFADCVAAGFPVMESYPAQCRAADGTLYVEEINIEGEYADEIVVEKPTPNEKIASPLVIVGQARGTWYFEASFSAELFDANGKSLGVAIITALGEWMTEDFVPFKGELSFEKPSTATGTLVIKNANASGLAEHDKKLIVPVYFEE